MRVLLFIAALCDPVAAAADALVATRTIRARAIITGDDVALVKEDWPGALRSADRAIGQEARQTIFAGRPVTAGDISPAALVERNGLVELVYDHAGLFITVEGRALGRGTAGDRIRVMNLESRRTITGRIVAPGRVEVP